MVDAAEKSAIAFSAAASRASWLKSMSVPLSGAFDTSAILALIVRWLVLMGEISVSSACQSSDRYDTTVSGINFIYAACALALNEATPLPLAGSLLRFRGFV